MSALAPRLLLAIAALLLAGGGVMHTLGYGGASAALRQVALPPFYAGSFRGLWLIDSASLVILASIFGLIAARPGAATRGIILLLALIPAVTAAFIYRFVGFFPPAHLLLAVAMLAAIAAFGSPNGGACRAERRPRPGE